MHFLYLPPDFPVSVVLQPQSHHLEAKGRPLTRSSPPPPAKQVRHRQISITHPFLCALCAPLWQKMRIRLTSNSRHSIIYIKLLQLNRTSKSRENKTMAEKNNQNTHPDNVGIPYLCICLHPIPSGLLLLASSALVNPFSVLCLLSPVFCLLLIPPILPSLPLVLLSLVLFHPLWLQVNSAKQTQFPQPQDQHNFLCPKALHQYSAPPHSKKQTQTKPIPPTQYATKAPPEGVPSGTCGAIRNTQYEKQTQSNPFLSRRSPPWAGRSRIPRPAGAVFLSSVVLPAKIPIQQIGAELLVAANLQRRGLDKACRLM